MVSFMKKVAELNAELTVEERNLLSVAYKNVIGAQRSAWRIISSIEQKEESNKDSEKLPFIRQYRGAVSSLIVTTYRSGTKTGPMFTSFMQAILIDVAENFQT